VVGSLSAMATQDRFQRYLEAGRAFTEMTRDQAESIVKDLVKAGELQQKRAKKTVDELLDRSRKNAEELRKAVRSELQSQIGALGIATKDDLAKLERKLTGATKKAAAKKTTAKKAGSSSSSDSSSSAAGSSAGG